MRGFRKTLTVLVAVCAAAVAAGCGTIRETLPSRSAKEQLVISTSVDRAIRDMPSQQVEGKKVYLDSSNLEGTDVPYVKQVVRDHLVGNGAVLVDSEEKADVSLELASGALSLDKRNYLLGLPELPLPIPMGGETLKTPELALLRATFYRGKTKLAVTAIDPETGTEAFEVPTCRGKSLDSYWWFLLFGPTRWSDIPMENE